MTASKLEFFAGPLDGDRLPCPENTTVLHFAAQDLLVAHRYERSGIGFRYQGLVPRAGLERVFSLSVGDRYK